MVSPIGVNMPEQSNAAWQPGRGLTLYGRKPALEALETFSRCASTACIWPTATDPGGIIAQIIKEAEQRGNHSLSRPAGALADLEKCKQDQGVALDVRVSQLYVARDLARSKAKPRTVWRWMVSPTRRTWG
jgi:hypothetical protein